MAGILVTGATGQLGSEVKVKSRNYFGYEFLFTDIETLDITNGRNVREFILDNHCDWIINCAAYNLVDKAETEPDKAFQINSLAVKNLVNSIRGTDSRLIHFSTDYVFDGRSNVPYNEKSVTNPLSTYGRSKLEGERFALQHPSSMVIRTSWLYSEFGNNFVKSILNKGKVNEVINVVYDQIGTPTYAADLAEAVLLIVSGVIRNQTAFNAGLYHYSNEGVCSWFDFATEIIGEAGFQCKINPILSINYPSSIQRPGFSVLDKSKIKENYSIFIPHWRTSLKKCLKQLLK
jgi:dTDP-4-dehydrorhamnose reductase